MGRPAHYHHTPAKASTVFPAMPTDLNVSLQKIGIGRGDERVSLRGLGRYPFICGRRG